MTKRVFRSICLAALGVFAASVGLFLFALYDYFGGVQMAQLNMQTDLASRAVTNEGIRYLEGFEAAGCRITWIAADGRVLYDNRSDSGGMENHLEREEIALARAAGRGESSRYSSTLLERALYSAKRLPDGSVIRLSVSQRTLLTLLFGMTQPLCAIFVIAVGLSLALASRLSKKIVEPLNALDLDKPLDNEGCDELAPVLSRLESQRRQIARQKEELDRGRKEFETVTENMAEGIVLMNREGNILDINPAAKRLFGADASRVGEHILSVCRDPRIPALLSSAEAGRRGEETIDLPGGRYQLLVSPVANGGELSGSVLLALDVTEKEKAERIRREFTANVSHELKTPLQTIAGSAELLADGLVKDADRAVFYTRILEEARRMIRLVDDIIGLSLLDEGSPGMERENVDLLALADETLRSLRHEARSAGVALSLSGEPAVISGIPRLLRGIVFNLCDNAVKYNREGGSVSVSVRNERGRAVLRVADTGIGIPPEHLGRVFERFYRVDKSRSKQLGGTGLGLSIVKHAAGLHGAKISLQSAEGVGTTVTVEFPGAAGAV